MALLLLVLLLLLSKLPESSVQLQAHSDGWIPAVMDAVMGLPSNSSWILEGGGDVTLLPCPVLASPRLALPCPTYLHTRLPPLAVLPAPIRCQATVSLKHAPRAAQNRQHHQPPSPAQSRLLRLLLRPCLS